MTFTSSQSSSVKLSVCITTLNRAAFIGQTLESILIQATAECEVVVLDGGSTDGTEQVVSKYTARFDRLRYVRQDENNGFDRDCDRVVQLSRGEYCWLMTDDDILKPGAVASVLGALRPEVSLIIVNTETRDPTMSEVLQRDWLNLETDRVYGPGEMDRLFMEVGHVLIYVGCVVVQRAIWIEREKESYYGSLFIYLGVIFQGHLPGETLVLSEPLISYRTGNAHTFSPRVFETFMFGLPSLVWSLPISDAAKTKVYSAEPWRSIEELLIYRGLGAYSLTEYRKWIRPQLRSIREALIPTLVALLPGVLVNALVILYYSMTHRRYRGVWRSEAVLQAQRGSRFHIRNWRGLRRES